MLTESFIAATLAANKPSQHLSAALKDVGIFLHELQPQTALRHGFRKSSTKPQCAAVSRSHIFAAQSEKAVINVYNREKGNQEATVPFPEKIRSIIYASGPEVLILGTEDGKLILWEVATGRLSTSAAAHLEPVTHLCLTPEDGTILSGSQDSTVVVWSLVDLLSFRSDSSGFSNEKASNAPVGIFSHHRSAIGALACGHSLPHTNFAVSASSDQTCFIWNIETLQTLQTVLLPFAPVSSAIDPADRAIYFGASSGEIAFVDVLSLGHKLNSSAGLAAPAQVTKEYVWTAPSDMGSANALALTYDATALISGHDGGAILRWDIAKRKVGKEIARLGQPVTNLIALRPDGLKQEPQGFTIPEIVKPVLDFGATLDQDPSVVPASYKFHAALSGVAGVADDDDMVLAMTSDGWPDSILDRAIQSLDKTHNTTARTDTVLDTAKQERLEEEIADLKAKLATHRESDLQRMQRSVERMAKREDIDLKRRQAYHDALKRGERKAGAEAAMQAAMNDSKAALAQIDAESDADAFDEKMDVS
jgi:pre-rRNA-processing protein IPI3